MTGGESVIDHGRHGCGVNVAAYALGALDPGEVDGFRRHLADCAVCRDELASFEQIVNVLPMSAPQYRAPESLRRRVVHTVAAESRMTPEVRFAPASRSRLRALRLPRPALSFGAAALALAIAAVVVVLAVGGGSSPSTRVIDAKVTGQGTASLRLYGGHAELVVNRFAAPPAGQIYEVWLQRSTGVPAPTTALFGVTGSGQASVDVPGDLHGVTHVLVTREPAGGTSAPTHAPVIVAPLS
ncbi:MAG: anti-sigma factor [Solirubrobacterales bacterium]|nr:anti-sigma factor [Solirubrobacterales bacterium]